MLYRQLPYRKTLLASLLLLVLGLCLNIGLATHISQAASPANSLHSWGSDVLGDLGDGTNTDSNVPVLTLLPTGVSPTVINSGNRNSLAAGSDGKLYAWGRGTEGELGNGASNDSSTPVVVQLPAGVTATALDGGQLSSMAIGSDGKVYGWGYNTFGNLGNGNNTLTNTPVVAQLPAGVSATAISAGWYHELAIGNDGKLYAWGANATGELGNGTNTDSNVPVVVSMPAGVTATAVAGGSNYSIALGSDGKVYSWGYNGAGELGNGTNTATNTPGVVSLPAGVTATAIASVLSHSLAIGSDGKVYGWGGNTNGELGNGTNTASNVPVVAALPAGVKATKIVIGNAFGFAIGDDLNLYAWGYNGDGSFGNGNNTDSNVPVAVTLPGDILPLDIAAGGFHTMAIFPPATLSMNDVSQNEGNTGTTPFNFTASLNYATNFIVTADYATSDVDTTAGVDYTAASGTLTFPVGSVSQPITVLVNGDTIVEPDETFQVTLSNSNNADLDSDFYYGTGTIVNDDVAPTLSIDSVSHNEGNNGVTPYVFTVTLSQASAQTVTVDYSTADGTATAPSDYNSAGGTVTFPPGTTTKTITVLVNTDFVPEPDETFFVNLSNPTIATIATGQGTGTIVNDDFPPTININNVTHNEGNTGTTSYTFNVVLSSVTGVTVTVNYATADGTATAPSDYTAASGTLTFPPLNNTQTVTVLVNGDTLVEPNEAFVVNLSSPTNATIATGQGTGFITNDDTYPTISINNVSQNEGNAGTTNFSFTASLSQSPAQAVTVDYATADGTATAGSDYVATSGTLTFPVGVSTQTITVLVNGDTTAESNETFVVNLSNPTNATILTAQGTGTIVNDDAAPTVSIDNVSQNEGNTGTTAFTFTASLSAVSGQTVTVNYATADGTAIAPSDYTAASGTLTFAPGTSTQTVTVLVNGDTLAEPNETFVVNLSNPTNATILTGQGTGTIVNDDGVPLISINNVSQNEGNTGTTSFTFNVTLAPASGQTVTVNYATADGTAIAPSDYTAASGTLTFAPGTTTKTATVLVNGDIANEPNENFTVNLSSPTNAAIGTGQGIGTIVNDDATPTLSIDNVSQNEGNTGTTAFDFTVSLSAASGQPVTVNYATADGTATAPSDYTAALSTLSFAPGTITQTVTVLVNGDTVVEPNETFTVNLSSPANATIATGQGTGTIVNDDVTPTLSIGNVSQVEGNTGTSNFAFAVSLSAPSSQTVTVAYVTTDGTAIAPGDYTTTSGTLTFPAGTITQTVNVAVVGDTVAEPDETFTVNLSGATNATIATAQGTGTIVNDDADPAMSINNVSQVEGNAGISNFVFKVSLSAVSGKTVTVTYATADGTATAGSDYVATSGTLTFAPGTTSQTIAVVVNGDTNVEPDETFTVNLGKPVNAGVVTAQGTGTIVNDDSPPTISIDNISQAEGNTGTANFGFTVNLSYAAPQTVTVDYATADGTATAGSDYVATSGTLTFLPGTSSQTVSVVVNGDTTVEGNETFTVNLSNPTNASIATAQGTGTIVNDDIAPGTSTISLTSDPNPSEITETVTFVANVMPVAATGTVTLTEGTTVLGVGTLSGGTVSFTISDLSLGSHSIVATYGGDATHSGSTSNTVIQVVVLKRAKPPVIPADLIAELRVTPDREFGLNVAGDNVLVYNLTVKNVGPGKANGINLRFPIDPELVVGYATTDEAGIWVQQIVTDTDTPYLRIGIPNMPNGTSYTLKVIMRAGPNAIAGSSLFTTYQAYWDDATGLNHHHRSNAVRVELTDGTSNRNDTDGAVQFYKLAINSDSTITVTGDFYAPEEWLDLWATDKSGDSTRIGSYQTDKDGKLAVTVDVSDWDAGTYVIAGRGLRTDITGAVAFTISDATSSSQPRTITRKDLSSTTLQSYLKEWNSAK